MADEIHDQMQRRWQITYNGKVDPNFQTEVTQSPDGIATVVPGAITPSTDNPNYDTQEFKIQHNGNVGEVEVTVSNDGDLGSGTVKIPAARTFSMLAPGGATGFTDNLSGEEPIA